MADTGIEELRDRAAHNAFVNEDPPEDPPEWDALSGDERDRWIQHHPGWKPDPDHMQNLWDDAEAEIQRDMVAGWKPGSGDGPAVKRATAYAGWKSSWHGNNVDLPPDDQEPPIGYLTRRFEELSAPFNDFRARALSLQEPDPLKRPWWIGAGHDPPGGVETVEAPLKAAKPASPSAPPPPLSVRIPISPESPAKRVVPKKRSMVPEGSGERTILEKNTWQALLPVEQQIERAKTLRESAAKKALEK